MKIRGVFDIFPTFTHLIEFSETSLNTGIKMNPYERNAATILCSCLNSIPISRGLEGFHSDVRCRRTPSTSFEYKRPRNDIQRSNTRNYSSKA
ncbi:hypothetical protein NPIL_261221 [Nephila pilipes]|uniref:Uncharacterized protein n=1 Tax=Nephila pilipes TaxID=299642 RepID=A0A8X6MIR6_NEPPI|nr:hypothetical protein NPIL_261221 [Nephila pilipes]